MNVEEQKKHLLNLICSGYTGITMAEAIAQTGMDYQSIVEAVRDLCAAGYPIGVVKVGRSICRLYPLEGTESS